MSHGTGATAECPLCGAALEPSVSGGWCTDSDCGASRVAPAATGGRRLVTDGGTTEDARAESGDEEEPDVAEVWPDGEDEDADAGTGEDAADGDSDDADAGADGDDAGTVTCPACETEIAVDDNFCRACGADVSGIDDTGELASCPSCETAVESEDRFCRECGEHLAPHRPGTDETPSAGAPAGASRGAQSGRGGNAAGGGSPAAAGTGGASAGQSGAVNAETVKHGGSAGSAAPADGTAAAEPEETGPRLSLVARNREVTVGDGDVVGKEIRSIIMDTGGDEEDAVRVHREHVRFEYEDGGFYLVDLGQNATVVNGEELEQGDRVPVEPGDRIDLSGVARIGVRQG
jgi:hypothetical protein